MVLNLVTVLDLVLIWVWVVLLVFLLLQKILFMMFARSINSSISMHHSEGLNKPPHVSLKYINAHIVVEHIHVTDAWRLMCIYRYADTESNLHNIVLIFGCVSLVA